MEWRSSKQSHSYDGRKDNWKFEALTGPGSYFFKHHGTWQGSVATCSYASGGGGRVCDLFFFDG